MSSAGKCLDRSHAAGSCATLRITVLQPISILPEDLILSLYSSLAGPHDGSMGNFEKREGTVSIGAEFDMDMDIRGVPSQSSL